MGLLRIYKVVEVLFYLSFEFMVKIYRNKGSVSHKVQCFLTNYLLENLQLGKRSILDGYNTFTVKGSKNL